MASSLNREELSPSKKRSSTADAIFEKEFKDKATKDQALKCKLHFTDLSKLSKGDEAKYTYFISLFSPAISYTVRVRTADDKDGGTEPKVYIVLIGTQACTDKIDLELVQKNGFEPGTAETFSVEGVDVGEIRKIEVGKWKYNVCVSSIIASGSSEIP